MLRAGELNRKISIQLPTEGKDTHGGLTQAFTELASVWAKYMPLRGRERLLAAQFMPDVEVKFVIRYRSDFDEKARIVFDGKTYQVGWLAEIGRHEGLEILAKLP